MLCSSLDSFYMGLSTLPGIGWLFPSPGWEVFSYYVFKYVLSPFLLLFSFWDPYNVNISTLDVSEIPYIVLISFHSFLFFVFSGSDFHYSVFQLTEPFSVSFSLLLFPFSVFFISVIVFFISLVVLYIFSLFCASILLLSSFTIIFTIITLNSFSGRLPIYLHFT